MLKRAAGTRAAFDELHQSAKPFMKPFSADHLRLANICLTCITLVVSTGEVLSQVPVRMKLLGIDSDSAGTVTIQAAQSTSRYTLTLPSSAGPAGAMLSTNGEGALQWIDPVSAGWSLVGNSGLDSTVNYLGSRDDGTSQPIILRTGGLERLRIAGGSGYVGIGTAQPTAQLHVQGALTDATVLRIRASGSASIMVAENAAGTGVLVLSAGGNLGVGGSTTPLTAMSIDGGLTLRPGSVNVTADNQLITVGNRSLLILNSNNPPVYRTIILANGMQSGQVLLLLVAGAAGNGVELADNANVSNANLTAAWLPENGDTIQLVWDGADWIELSRSNN